MRIMGLDIGEKRIGVALSDPSQILATSLTVVVYKSEGDALRQIDDLARGHEVESIIVGLPLSLNGERGPQAQLVQSFAQKIEEYTQLTVMMADERFSTFDAERILVEAEIKPKKRKSRIDSVAAAFILQGYLDRRETIQ